MMHSPTTPAQLTTSSFRTRQMFQEQMSLVHSGPQLSQQSSPDSFARFLDRSSIYGAYDTQSSRCNIQDGSPVCPTSAAPPCSVVAGPSLSVDIPPSLSGFRTIAGGHSLCEWSDTLPFLLPQQLNYEYPSTDKSAASSESPVPPLSSFCINLPDSSTMSAPPTTSPSLPGALPSLPGPSPSATSSDITQSIRNACAGTSRSSSRTSKSEGSGPRPREKKHACWMCEKSFDRPSTLRKHLLVHTGEKAFVCDTCGRRFGVASNLNRHVKRCILKPVNAVNRLNQMSAPTTSVNNSPTTDTSTTSIASSTTLDPVSPGSSSVRSNKRARESDVGPSPPPTSPGESTSRPSVKRRRRAPSPSQWIPQSLVNFNITPPEYTKATAVPLPPVTAYKDAVSDEWIEERDSWNENVGVLPYHPCGWKGTLPGPAVGLGGKDVMNLGLVNGGTYVMGRLVMV